MAFLGPRDAGGAVFFAAGFLTLGLTGTEDDFFLGAATPLPFATLEPDAMSLTFFSGSVLDFLATILPLADCQTETRERRCCKWILQSGCVKRGTSPTVRPCGILFFAG